MTIPESGDNPVEDHFEAATIIPISAAHHFAREGFSGDVFVPKEAKMGFIALQVEVDGEHPRKEILKGNTRSYYVVSGEGTFTLNDATKEVGTGDLIVIPPENQYAYSGKMTLFEFNVSRSNSFRDRLVLPEEPLAGPTEREIALQLRREQRLSLAKAVGQILSRGYTLTNKDIAKITPYYGYSSRISIGQLISGWGFRNLVSRAGYNLEVEKYKGRDIYLDDRLLRAETDIESTKIEIDRRLAATVTARQQQNY